MAGFRIEGTPEEIAQIIHRIKKVFHTNQPSKLHPKVLPGGIVNESLFWCYMRLYMYPGTDTLYEQLDACQRDSMELAERLEEARKKIELLEEELGKVKQPRPYDVVMGTPHQNTK